MSCTLVFLCEVCRVEQWRARIIELLTMWYLHFLYTYRHFCMTDIFCSRVSDSFWSVVSFVCFHACSGCTNRAGLWWSNWFALLIPNQQIAYAINGAGLCRLPGILHSVVGPLTSRRHLLWTSELPACVVCQCTSSTAHRCANFFCRKLRKKMEQWRLCRKSSPLGVQIQSLCRTEDVPVLWET